MGSISIIIISVLILLFVFFYVLMTAEKDDDDKECSRQEAKAYTFKPLYGGMMDNENEIKKYLAKLHITSQENVYKKKVIFLPSGREYHIPDMHKTMSPYVTTKIRGHDNTVCKGGEGK